MSPINEHYAITRGNKQWTLFERVDKPDPSKDTSFEYQKPKAIPLKLKSKVVVKPRVITTIMVEEEKEELIKPKEVKVDTLIPEEKVSFWQKWFGKK